MPSTKPNKLGQKAVNTVTGIYGWKGGGKTVAMTMFLLLESKLAKLNIATQKKEIPVIYSNVELAFPFKWLDGNDVAYIADHLQNSAIGIDELHEYADSRSFASQQNKRVADFFLQSRHTNANVYYTTQYKDQIDKRIRRITDIDIVMENLFIDSDMDGDDDLFRMVMSDRRRPDKKPIERIIYAKPLFDLYNSSQRINPFEMEER
jgi:hypothetical protein